jgi:hypothetical protein
MAAKEASMTAPFGLSFVGQELPSWFNLLQSWKALAGPFLIGLLTVLCGVLGYFVVSGARMALGIRMLDRSSIGSPDYILYGALVLGALGIVLTAVTGLFALIGWGFDRLVPGLWPLLGAVTRSTPWSYMVFAAGSVGPLFGLWIVKRSYVDSITRTGNVFGREWVGFMSALAAIFWLIVILSRLILTALAINIALKIMYGVWATLLAFVLLVSLAALAGNYAKFGQFPVVKFDSMKKFGANVVFVLLGSDDKLYAMLLLPTPVAAPAKEKTKSGPANKREVKGAAPVADEDKTDTSGASESRRMILYLPRTEVKWMVVVYEDNLPATVTQTQAMVPPALVNPLPSEDKP